MTRLPSLGPRGEGWFALQVALLLALAGAGFLADDAWDGPVAVATSLAGLALLLAGVALAGRGLWDLGRELTPMPHPRDGARLIEHGVYAHARHPIYGGLIVGAVGWGLVAASPLTLLLAGVLAVFLGLKSRREEAWLCERYPGYVGYMGRTRRFIPYLY